MIISLREGAERIDVPLRYRPPATLSAQPTTTADLDLVAVERALSGETPRPQLQPLEAHFAWQLITSPIEEAPARPVAALLGVTERTIGRWRAGHTRAAAAYDETPGGGDMQQDRWDEKAACKGLDLEGFFPVGDGGKAGAALYWQAVRVCQGCPVRVECLRFAMRAEGKCARASRSGVFGGMTPAERDELYQHRVQAAA
ncbi:WhiB family transcriptional regulator [Streptomyces sp. Y1]|uniref:WhiB family transcriptional regulator n=1 Tax=Streptomyces sp. Y1 TaxID=3238634 RepID=A0AB39TJN7_9ACTN